MSLVVLEVKDYPDNNIFKKKALHEAKLRKSKNNDNLSQ